MSNVANLGTGGLRPFRLGSMRGLMENLNKRCDGQHDIFVCDNLYVASEGKIVTVTVCRSCAQFYYSEKQIAQPHQDAEFLNKENKQ